MMSMAKPYSIFNAILGSAVDINPPSPDYDLSRLYFTTHQIARKPSRKPIFLPSS